MRIGVLGGGQLAQMLALAGIPLGCRFVFYDPQADCCAATLGTHICAEYDNWPQLKKFAEDVDVITYEFENIPLASIDFVQQLRPVYPDQRAVKATQDRLVEKNLFVQLGIPTVRFQAVDEKSDLLNAAENLGYPFILKSRRGGYDGKGQIRIRSAADIDKAALEIADTPSIAEEWAEFSREVSLISVRRKQGDARYYDLSENAHSEGILQTTFNCPEDPFFEKALHLAQILMGHLNYVGVLTLEFFQCGDQLLANEFAPRVHNSGHWTIEGAATSQFENHIRAILDLPLGDIESLFYSSMINLVGRLPDLESTLVNTGVHYHSYGKQPRLNRKLGHLTLCSSDKNSLKEKTAAELSKYLKSFD